MENDEFEWDDGKNGINRQKHGLSFEDADLLFDGRPKLTLDAASDVEPRLKTIAIVAGRFRTVIWTLRGTRRRIISFRSSRDEERRKYRHIHG